MVKPTGWVVDMRHYIDEDTGDLPDVIPERVLSLAICIGMSWRTCVFDRGFSSHLTQF
jgi:hypothetical protein